MARSKEYAVRWTEANGHRYKLVFTPANDQNATSLSGATVEIPDDVIEVVSDGSYEFDKLPIGMPQTPTFKVTVKLHKLRSSDELRDLRTFITHPTFANGGILDYAGGLGYGYTFNTSNVWSIYTDEGASLAAGENVEPETLLFQGAQHRLPSRKLKVIKYVKATTEIELFHIVRVCLETLTPTGIAGSFFYAGYAAQPSNGAQYAYDVIYAGNETTYLKRWGHSSLIQPRGKFYRLYDLFAEIQALARKVYQQYTRKPGFFQMGSVNVGVSGYGTPFDHLKFYKQSYDSNNTRGALLDRTEVYFLGYIWSGFAPFTQPNILGGFLSERSENSIFKYPTAWDFLKACSESTLAKGEIVITDEQILGVAFGPVLHSGVSLNFKASDIRDEGGEGMPEVEFEIGANAISDTKVSIAGAIGQDTANVTYKAHGALSEQGRNITTVFSNSPVLCSAEGSARVSGSDLLGAFVEGFPTRCLYYIERPFANGRYLTGTVVPIRVHDSIGIDVGKGAWADGPGYVLEESTAAVSFPGPGDDPGDWEEDFYIPLLGALKELQLNSSLPMCVARACTKLFGSEDQTLFKADVAIEKCYPNNMGHLVRLVDDTGVAKGANIFLDEDEDDYLDSVPLNSYITAMTVDPPAGLARLTLLAIPPPV